MSRILLTGRTLLHCGSVRSTLIEEREEAHEGGGYPVVERRVAHGKPAAPGWVLRTVAIPKWGDVGVAEGSCGRGGELASAQFEKII